MPTLSKLKRRLLATHYTATVPVVAHAIKSCLALGWKFNQVCCIRVPFIQIDDLRGALVRINIASQITVSRSLNIRLLFSAHSNF